MTEKLTEQDIHVVKDSIGANGRAKSTRIWAVYVGHHTPRDARGRTRLYTRHKAAYAAGLELLAELNAKETT